MTNAKALAASAALAAALLSGCAANPQEGSVAEEALVGDDASSSADALFPLFGGAVTFDAPGVSSGKLRANALVTCLPDHHGAEDCTLDAYWAWTSETEKGPWVSSGVTSFTKTGADAAKLSAAIRSVPELGADGTVAEVGAKRAVLDCVGIAIAVEQGRLSPVRNTTCTASAPVTVVNGEGGTSAFQWTDDVKTIAGDKAATLFGALEGVTDVAQHGGTLRSAEIVSYDYTHDVAPGFPSYDLWVGHTETGGDASSIPGKVWEALSDVPVTASFGKRGFLTCLKVDAGVTCSLRRPS